MRTDGVVVRGVHADDMFSPVTGGLHCGTINANNSDNIIQVFLLGRRRAPLRLEVALVSGDRAVDVPADLRWAPLRQPDRQDASLPDRGAPARHRQAPLQLGDVGELLLQSLVVLAGQWRAPLRHAHDPDQRQDRVQVFRR